MLTASYASDEMRALDDQAKEAGITILNEVGLDPGMLLSKCLKFIISESLILMNYCYFSFDFLLMRFKRYRSFISYGVF